MSADPVHRVRPRTTTLIGLAALLLVVVTAYLPGMGGGFVFDDFPNIVFNSALHVRPDSPQTWIGAAMASPAHGLPRPLAMLSFAANHWFTGLDPVPLKLTNLAIHVLNVLLVFGLVRCLLRFQLSARDGDGDAVPERFALLIAALWALHPINLMAVLFIVQRMESLSHCFVFAGLWLYSSGRCAQLQGRGGGWPRLLFGLVGCTGAGVLVKESAALLPLYAFLLEVFLFRFRSATAARADRRLVFLFIFVLALPMLVGGGWQTLAALDPRSYAGREFTLAERLLTEPRVLLDYLRWILVPDLGQLALNHDDMRVSHGLLDPPSTLAALLALPLLAGLAWMSRRRWPLAALGLAWFLAAHVLTATVIPLELVFEHRNYFASLGICLVAAQLLLPLARAPRAWLAPALGAGVALALGSLTFLRANEWRDPMSFAVAEAAKHPASPRASYYLAWMLITRSGYVPDSPQVAQAFEALARSRRLPDAGVLPDQAALVLAARTGRAQDPEWWRHMQQRLAEHPIGPQETGALAALVTCEIQGLCRFPQGEMIATFGAALSRGDHPEVLNNYANYALNVLHDPDLALKAWGEASRLSPGEPEYRVSLVKLQVALHRDAEARAGIKALRATGLPGQYEAQAGELEQRLRSR